MLHRWTEAVKDKLAGKRGMKNAPCQTFRFEEVPLKRLLNRRRAADLSRASAIGFVRTRAKEVFALIRRSQGEG